MDLFSFLLLALIAAVTYIQTIQGFISALIMCVLVLICTPLAFTTYEWVAFSFLIGPLGDLALPVALMGMFLIPLIALRFGMDALITRANLIPVLIDRAGAAVAGFFAAYLMAGVLALAVQMVPFGGTFLGHRGLDPDTGELNALFLKPDDFAVGYASMMSNGLFSGGQDWFADHPDLIQEVIWAQSANQDIRHVVPPDSVRLMNAEIRDYIFEKTPGVRRRRQQEPSSYKPISPPNGKYWFLVRLKLLPEASDKDEEHRFARRQFRLLGHENPDTPASNFAPVAINDNEDPTRAVTIVSDKLYRPSAGGEIDVVFEVPDAFVPVYIEYKMGARADLTNVVLAGDEAPPKEEDEAASESRPASTPAASSASPDRSPSTARSDRGGRRGGRVSGSRGTGENAKFSDELPVVMTDFESSDIERSNESLANGHIYGNRDDQGGSGSGDSLTKFQVPSDKRMFQLDVQVLRAGSTLGRALSFAVRSLKNYHLHDDTGHTYPVVGQYAIAVVDGVEVVEIQYYPEAVANSNRGGMRDFRRIKASHLRGNNYRLAYLFLVEPGAKLTEFTTGRGRRPTELRDLDLLAPQ